MKITLSTPTYKTIYSVEVKSDDLDIEQVKEQLLRPVLLAAGYQPDSIEEILGPPDFDFDLALNEEYYETYKGE